MRSTRLVMLAVPIIIGMLTFCQGVSACNGSTPGKVYLDKSVTVGAGQYHSEPFTVAKQDYQVRVDDVQSGRILIISDPEMGNFTAGKNYTVLYNSSRAPTYNHYVRLEAGTYWAVWDNREATMPSSGKMNVERPLMQEKCGGVISPAPGFDASPLVLALVLAAIAAVILGARKN